MIVSDENIMMVSSMGFSTDMARTALKKTDNNVERAIEWIFSHPDGDTEPAAVEPSPRGDERNQGLTDGAPRLVIISRTSGEMDFILFTGGGGGGVMGV